MRRKWLGLGFGLHVQIHKGFMNSALMESFCDKHYFDSAKSPFEPNGNISRVYAS